MVVGVAELLRIMVRRRKLWLTFSSSLMPMPPCSWIASWLIRRALSAILIFAAEMARERSCALDAESAWLQARKAIDFACSYATKMSTIRCCSAWKVPIGTPNCLRVLRYSSVASQENFIAPTASAQMSAVAKSTTASITGSALPSAPSNSPGVFASTTSAARISSSVR